MAETNSEIWPSHIHHESPDRGLFFHQPGMLCFLPDILWPAHDQHHVIRIERRNRLAIAKLDGVGLDSVGAQEVTKHTWMFDPDMLQDEKLHANPIGTPRSVEC